MKFIVKKEFSKSILCIVNAESYLAKKLSIEFYDEKNNMLLDLKASFYEELVNVFDRDYKIILIH